MFSLFSKRLPTLLYNSYLRPAQFQFNLTAEMSKYLPNARKKRIPLNTKKVGRGYKKGYGGRKEGRMTSKGRFILMPERCTELVVPDLTNFKLKAYVGPGAKRNITDINVKI